MVAAPSRHRLCHVTQLRRCGARILPADVGCSQCNALLLLLLLKFLFIYCAANFAELHCAWK